jgi:hypothetical protein
VRLRKISADTLVGIKRFQQLVFSGTNIVDETMNKGCRINIVNGSRVTAQVSQ